MKHQLEIDSVLLKHKDKTILSDIYLASETQKVSALLGRNGAGKASLMQIIFGSLKPQYVSRQIDGIPLVKYKSTTKTLISYLPQHLTLKRIFTDFQAPFDEFSTLFPECKDFRKKAFARLSGGEKRLVELFVIIKKQALFCLLDEPYANLMPLHIEKVNKLIEKEKQQKGFIISDHQYRSVLQISDTIYFLKEGSTNLISHQEELQKLSYQFSL